MQIAILLYEQFTALDAVGPYDTLAGLPGAEPVFVAERRGPVRNDSGRLRLVAEATLEEVTRPDIVLVPGGPFPHEQQKKPEVLDWLRAVDATTTWTASVCTGSLILGSAGLLTGRRATTHWTAMDGLRALGVEVVDERYVFDGKYVTAAGVSAGIDMGLALAGRIAGDATAQTVQLMLQYDPRPPYDAGSPHKAPAELTARMLRQSA
ncbi:DJ-1/PfpI family protein [Streptomyces zingiberis]|uniref:DJ-1/PfpI family protein n=1 Tax=Streptomyces zingiberis TaxID=2053010 RepID=A0ABX1BUA6_9ACTN|nr:DJ-1/PfpI family protein [Streptomyces zingiberis]NJQ00011.1 DJ-1/PfpI family protein [Streptomyces zingiberis]